MQKNNITLHKFYRQCPTKTVEVYTNNIKAHLTSRGPFRKLGILKHKNRRGGLLTWNGEWQTAWHN